MHIREFPRALPSLLYAYNTSVLMSSNIRPAPGSPTEHIWRRRALISPHVWMRKIQTRNICAGRGVSCWRLIGWAAMYVAGGWPPGPLRACQGPSWSHTPRGHQAVSASDRNSFELLSFCFVLSMASCMHWAALS